MATNKRLIKSNDEGGLGLSFNTVLYEGNETSQSITTVGFDPDMIWLKNRDISSSHLIFDVQRSNNYLIPNSTQGEESSSSNNVNLIPGGFSLSGGGTGSNHGTAGENDYVAWCWKAGGAAVTNTDGTITSQVSANTEAGFSIVSWTGVGNHSIGHGLGVKPDVVIIKRRSSAGVWITYHVGVDPTNPQDYFLQLNDTAARQFYPQIFPFTFDSNIFSLYDSTTSQDYIAYCFAEVPGFSKFGSYAGTGSAGNFQNCGFEPAFVMVKITNTTGAWWIFDNKRTISNPRDLQLRAESSDSEANLNGIDFLVNGFSFNSALFNDSGLTFIYMAFANQF